MAMTKLCKVVHGKPTSAGSAVIPDIFSRLASSDIVEPPINCFVQRNKFLMNNDLTVMKNHLLVQINFLWMW
jgi:hypothetical protein